MSSIFFQISGTDFLEAIKLSDYPAEQFALRIVSFKNGTECIVYLPDVSIAQLSTLASIFRVKIVPNFRHLDDLRRYLYGRSYYY